MNWLLAGAGVCVAFALGMRLGIRVAVRKIERERKDAVGSWGWMAGQAAVMYRQKGATDEKPTLH